MHQRAGNRNEASGMAPGPRYHASFSAALAAGVCLVLSACVPLNRLTIEKPFAGLNSALDETSRAGGILRVLAVHGMGSHSPGYSDQLFSRLASRLSLHRSGAFRTVRIINQGLLFGYLRTSDYVAGQRRLRVYELTWSPITSQVKRQQFGYDKTFTSSRQLLNGVLKEGLLDYSLSDAVLYAGNYRTNMRFPIKFAVKRLLEDGFGLHDQICFVTYSLGSYMCFDTLRALSRDADAGGAVERLGIPSAQVKRIAERTTRIYMLANQLPLLELTEISRPISTPAGLAGQSTGPAPHTPFNPAPIDQQMEGPLRDFVGLRLASKGQPAVTQIALPKKLQIVAFSDPNDLLSFPLQSQNWTNGAPGLEVTAANVEIVIAHWSYLGVVANPVQAHSGWDNDCRALDLMAFGKPRSPQSP